MSENKDTKKGNKFDWQILKRLFKFIKPYKFHFYGLCLITLFTAVMAPALPLLIQRSIGEYLPVRDLEMLSLMFVLMIVTLAIQAVLQFANTYLSGWLGQSVIRDIRIQLYQHIMKLRLKFFDRTPVGRLVTRNVSDIETLAEVFSQGLAALVSEILQVVAILIAMFIISWKLTLVSLSVLPFLLISTYIFKEKVKGSFDAVRTAVASLNTFVQERVTGMFIVQIFNAEKRELDKFVQINNEHRQANLKSVKYYSIYFPVAEVLGAIGTGLIVWYGGRGILEGFIADESILITYFLFLNMFFRPIRLIADRFNTLQMGIVSTDRIIKLLDSTDHMPDDGSIELKDVKGEIKFENVWFAYDAEEYVLKDISLYVKPGETIAFVGATGAGKSSVINLLNRYYEIQKGTIELDGKNINEYSINSLRENIGVVLQDVFLFSESIRQNISLGNIEITDAQIWEAADRVGARKFIERLPGGLDYNVQERGVSLSVGQRQLISFVRAMVYDPKIMVLDEATSSVDTETEHLIQNAIDKMLKGRTSVVIAHRLSTIQKADKIIVLDKGEIKEFGSHSELMGQQGFYWQLHQMQYKNVS